MNSYISDPEGAEHVDAAGHFGWVQLSHYSQQGNGHGPGSEHVVRLLILSPCWSGPSTGSIDCGCVTETKDSLRVPVGKEGLVDHVEDVDPAVGLGERWESMCHSVLSMVVI